MAKKKSTQKTKTTGKKYPIRRAAKKTSNLNKPVNSTEKKSSKKKYQQNNVDDNYGEVLNEINREEKKVAREESANAKMYVDKGDEGFSGITEIHADDGLLPSDERSKVQNSESLSNLASPNTIPMNKNNAAPTNESSVKYDWSHVFTVQEEDLNANRQRVFVQRVYAPLNCSFRRVSDIEYELKGFNEDGVTPFVAPLKLHDKQEADMMWKELIEMETNRPRIKAEKEAALKSDKAAQKEAKAESPAVEPTEKKKRGRPSKADKEQSASAKIADASKKPAMHPSISVVDVDAVLTGHTAAPATQNILNPQQQALTPEALNIMQVNEMENYAKTIHESIMGGFRVRMQGGISAGEVQEILNGCLKEYKYELQNDNGAFFINVRRGEHVVRIPREEGAFLPII